MRGLGRGGPRARQSVPGRAGPGSGGRLVRSASRHTARPCAHGAAGHGAARAVSRAWARPSADRAGPAGGARARLRADRVAGAKPERARDPVVLAGGIPGGRAQARCGAPGRRFGGRSADGAAPAGEELMAERVLVKVPDIGDFHDVSVIEILVKPGQAIKAEQSLITLESDKASMEIPSPLSGIVRNVLVKLGDKVSQGSPILELEPAESAAAAASAAAPSSAKATEGMPAAATAARAGEASARAAAPTPQPAASAPGPAATRRRSVLPTWAAAWRWSSAIRRWAACA